MKNIAIVCDVMRGELQNLKKELPEDNLDLIFLEQHLHDKPNRMRDRLQEEIDKIDNKYENIILAYGLCSNGVVGLKSDKHKIIIPKIDDCISLFLGSREKYVEQFKKDPATYYLCRGWIEYGSDPYRAYLLNTGQEDKIPAEWIGNKERYGIRKVDQETSKYLIVQMMRNYNRVLLIDNNDLEEKHRNYAREMVDFLTRILGKKIRLVEIKGSSRLLKKLFQNKWHEDEFILKARSEQISQNDFM